ncbi:hypothetical protein SAMN05421823_102217 [Catalinimonas alkaloidigena]|uniref:Outer membrane protein beta-barrel domain-containing protein n=2 Tax=Catalinimonas alkaloidigena TaxID=1075417 RepID=A0A1G9A954_9BACT|nr:hypothetical protein SAMN05421823_102217 [Catalinimonas alkaloidigena]
MERRLDRPRRRGWYWTGAGLLLLLGGIGLWWALRTDPTAPGRTTVGTEVTAGADTETGDAASNPTELTEASPNPADQTEAPDNTPDRLLSNPAPDEETEKAQLPDPTVADKALSTAQAKPVSPGLSPPFATTDSSATAASTYEAPQRSTTPLRHATADAAVVTPARTDLEQQAPGQVSPEAYATQSKANGAASPPTTRADAPLTSPSAQPRAASPPRSDTLASLQDDKSLSLDGGVKAPRYGTQTATETTLVSNGPLFSQATPSETPGAIPVSGDSSTDVSAFRDARLLEEREGAPATRRTAASTTGLETPQGAASRVAADGTTGDSASTEAVRVIGATQPPAYADSVTASPELPEEHFLPEEKTTKPNPMPLEVPTRLALQLFVAPDISRTPQGVQSGLGGDVGLSLEMFLTPQLSLTAGAVYASKHYTAKGAEYQPWPGYWSHYGIPDRIAAVCRVLDVPLNLRYYALQGRKNALFASAGVSSYFMLYEQYDYIYNYSSRQPYRHREYNANQHYFAVGNVSVGYQRQLGDNLAFQLEPFVKLALGDVGFGNIRLQSAGVFLTFKYRMY